MINFKCVWDNQAVSDYDASIPEIIDFRNRTGACKVIFLQWDHEGKIVKTSYPGSPLPDKSGIVIGGTRDGTVFKNLVVINLDGSLRCTIAVPTIDEKSKPGQGFLEIPPSSWTGGEIEWGIQGNDGNTDYLFEFDWRTGKILKFISPPRPW